MMRAVEGRDLGLQAVHRTALDDNRTCMACAHRTGQGPQVAPRAPLEAPVDTHSIERSIEECMLYELQLRPLVS